MGSESDHLLATGPGGGRLERAVDLAIRIGRAWRALTRERRYAAGAAVALFLTLFLPWYQDTLASSHQGQHRVSAVSQTVSVSGWGAFSFVEAAVLIIAVAILALLFQRAEGRAFHLPGGDGSVIAAAGGWACFLIIWRIFDHSGSSTQGLYVLSTGVDWGIFLALFVAAGLSYAGVRIRSARQPEPPLPTEGYAVFDGNWREPTKAERAATPRAPAPSPGPDPRRRSSWRPSEPPEWRDTERPTGWLTAPPKWSQHEE